MHPILRSLGGLPSPAEKARILIDYGRRQGIATLVETGTYLGDTVAACLPHFEHVYTIEFDEALCDAARSRFKDHPNGTVIWGDSYTELNRLAFEIMEPALFWLDAHNCAGPTAKGPHDPPLEWEPRAVVLRGKGDVIVIDDARTWVC